MAPIEKLARIAEIEFSDIVDTTELIGTKLRILLVLSTSGCPENWPTDSAIIGKTNLPAYHTVTITSPIPNGNIFSPIRITFITVLRTT